MSNRLWVDIFIFYFLESFIYFLFSLVALSQGRSLVMVLGLLIAASSFVAEHTHVLGCSGLVVLAPKLDSISSVVEGQGLSCSAVCRIFPDKGSNLCCLHWQADS